MVVAHECLQSESSQRSTLFLHGILGSGMNWRGFGLRLVSAVPDSAAVLVDLRGHGASPAGAPPHTLDAAAADLQELEAGLSHPVSAVLGHSFGGKVALAYAYRRLCAGRPLEALILVDVPLAAAREPMRAVADFAPLRTLRSMPTSFVSREQFTERVVADGHGRAIALWLGKNLERTPAGDFRLRVSLEQITALIHSHFGTDLWPAFHEVAASSTRVLVLLGGRSDVGRGAEGERYAQCALHRRNVVVERVEEAGHWVHVDAPDLVSDHICSFLSAAP